MGRPHLHLPAFPLLDLKGVRLTARIVADQSLGSVRAVRSLGRAGPVERYERYLVSHLAAQHARWSMNNSHRRCPAYIDELLEYAYLDEPVDAWGTRLEMVCESPLGEFGIVSAGADLRFRTADDIHSWEVRP